MDPTVAYDLPVQVSRFFTTGAPKAGEDSDPDR